MTQTTTPAPTRMVAGQRELILQALTYPFHTILDIGTGGGGAAKAFHAAGKSVTATGFDVAAYSDEAIPEGIDFHADADVCDMARFENASFDAVWCAHVLEHTLNPGGALYRRNGDLERARDYFPALIGVRQGFDGDLDMVNWAWRVPVHLRRTGWKYAMRRWLARRLRRLL